LPRAILEYDAVLRLQPELLPAITNMIIACNATGEIDKCREWSYVALAVIDRYLRLHPDQEDRRSRRPLFLHFIGNDAEALAAARELTDEHSARQIRDGASLYNIAYLVGVLGEPQEALRIFRKSIDAGFRAIAHIRDFLFDEKNGMATLAGTPEHDEAMRIVEDLVREEEAKKHG